MSFRFVKATGVAVLATVTAAAACAPPDTSQRGFGSTQVAHLRDTALSLRSFSLDNGGLYLARFIPNIVPTGVSAPYDRSLISFATGIEQTIAPGVLTAQLLPSADGTGRTLVMGHFPSDDVIPVNLASSAPLFVDLTFLDEVSGVAFDVKDVDVLSYDLGATRADPIVVTIEDETSKTGKSLQMGLPESLIAVPTGLNQLVGRDHVGLVALTPSSDGSSTQSFSRVRFDGTPPTEIVSGMLGTQVIVSGPMGPAAPSTSTIPTGGVVPSIACPQATATNPTPSCLLFYDRNKVMLPRTGFVHDLDAGTDWEMPGQLPGAFADAVRLAPTGRDIFWPSMSPTGSTRLSAWHVGDDHAASCDLDGSLISLTFGVNAWRPAATALAAAAGSQFVVVAQPSSQSSEKPGSWTLVAGTAGQECHVVARGSNLVNQLFYAPDGSAVAFKETDPIDVSKIYVTDGDASPPRLVATGAYFFNIDFHDPRHLLLWHSNTDGYSLSWLDVSTTPATEHPVADRVRWDARGSWAWINPRWVLMADADSIQDGSYSLNVVDLDTGTHRLVSRGVVDFRTPWFTPPDGATSLTVAYVVRSRAPSSQDGLWVANLNLADFPP